MVLEKYGDAGLRERFLPLLLWHDEYDYELFDSPKVCGACLDRWLPDRQLRLWDRRIDREHQDCPRATIP